MEMSENWVKLLFISLFTLLYSRDLRQKKFLLWEMCWDGGKISSKFDLILMQGNKSVEMVSLILSLFKVLETFSGLDSDNEIV